MQFWCLAIIYIVLIPHGGQLHSGVHIAFAMVDPGGSHPVSLIDIGAATLPRTPCSASETNGQLPARFGYKQSPNKVQSRVLRSLTASPRELQINSNVCITSARVVDDVINELVNFPVSPQRPTAPPPHQSKAFNRSNRKFKSLTHRPSTIKVAGVPRPISPLRGWKDDSSAKEALGEDEPERWWKTVSIVDHIDLDDWDHAVFIVDKQKKKNKIAGNRAKRKIIRVLKPARSSAGSSSQQTNKVISRRVAEKKRRQIIEAERIKLVETLRDLRKQRQAHKDDKKSQVYDNGAQSTYLPPSGRVKSEIFDISVMPCIESATTNKTASKEDFRSIVEVAELSVPICLSTNIKKTLTPPKGQAPINIEDVESLLTGVRMKAHAKPSTLGIVTGVS